jgi:hypothetical protein
MLRQVDCLGSQLRLVIDVPGAGKTAKTIRLLIADLNNIAVRGEPVSFACGVQKPRKIIVDYVPKNDAKLGTSGQVAGIDLQRQP